MSGRQELQVIGQIIGYHLGHVIVALQWTGPNAYRVSVCRPGIAGLIGAEIDWASYEDEQQARAEARRMVGVYRGRAHADIEQRRHELTILIDNNERRYGPDAARRLRQYSAEADAIETLRGRCDAARAAAGIEHNIAATAVVDLDAIRWDEFDRKLATTAI